MESPDVEAVILTVADAGEVSAMLRAAGAEYARGFHPFAFDEETVRGEMAKARRDQFFGVRVSGALAGFFMMRGLDAGYARPAFGVFIGEEFSGRGLASAALGMAETWCRENGIGEMMLTVDADNAAARGVYARCGFHEERRDGEKLFMAKRILK